MSCDPEEHINYEQYLERRGKETRAALDKLQPQIKHLAELMALNDENAQRRTENGHQ